MRHNLITWVLLIPIGHAAAQEPATVTDAAKVLDLNAFPLMNGAPKPGSRSLASLTYEAKASIQDALDHQRKALQAKGWTELPEAQATEQYASATYRHGEYRLSLMIFPSAAADRAGFVTITLNQHGNVDTAKLPTPDGAKEFYRTPVSTAYLSEGSIDATREAVDKRLREQGWTPHGTAGDVAYFKKNAVRLSARVAEAPAQDGKTFIDYSTALMSADLPAPEDALGLQYSDAPTQISLDLPGSLEDAAATYRDLLLPLGWKPTTERPIQERFEQFWIFRNDAGDLLEMKLRDVDGKARLLLRYRMDA